VTEHPTHPAPRPAGGANETAAIMELVDEYAALMEKRGTMYTNARFETSWLDLNEQPRNDARAAVEARIGALIEERARLLDLCRQLTEDPPARRGMGRDPPTL